MELDLQSLFGLHVYSCTHWLRPPQPPPLIPPHLGSYTRAYWSAKIHDVSLGPPALLCYLTAFNFELAFLNALRFYQIILLDKSFPEKPLIVFSVLCIPEHTS
jgi:hypothetical protein